MKGLIHTDLGLTEVTFGVGVRVKPDSWRFVSRLSPSDWAPADFRLVGDNAEYPVKIEITGRLVRWERSVPINGGGLRVRITFVGDGSPNVICGGWLSWADCEFRPAGKEGKVITRLWQFTQQDGTKVYSQVCPPDWSPEMKAAVVAEAPAEVCAEFEPEALETFRREYGAPLHTVTVDPRCPGHQRHARVC